MDTKNRGRSPERQRHKTKTQHTRGEVFEGGSASLGNSREISKNGTEMESNLKIPTHRAEPHTLKCLSPLRKIIL